MGYVDTCALGTGPTMDEFESDVVVSLDSVAAVIALVVYTIAAVAVALGLRKVIKRVQ